MIDKKSLAQKIITANQYMVLATSGSDGKAWVSPVVYVYDSDWKFYFISKVESRHVQNLKENAELSVAIFDSHQDFGEGCGLQIEATARELPLVDALKASLFFLQRKWLYGKLADRNWFTDVLNSFSYVMYEVTPTKFWMNNPEPKTPEDEDLRVEVTL